MNSSLKGNKRAIGASKSFLDILADATTAPMTTLTMTNDQRLSLRDAFRISIIFNELNDAKQQVQDLDARFARLTDPALLDTAKPRQDNLLSSKRIALALIASNEAKVVDIPSTIAASKPLLKDKKGHRPSDFMPKRGSGGGNLASRDDAEFPPPPASADRRHQNECAQRGIALRSARQISAAESTLSRIEPLTASRLAILSFLQCDPLPSQACPSIHIAQSHSRLSTLLAYLCLLASFAYHTLLCQYSYPLDSPK
jgi:hypothetical protein